ncbi:glycosyltransferase family 2 protein, partial [Campylobacter insulaenigrae]|uniref:glycosyltransferase family 2 protein n=1 Tax=Campylobacter insulaenigrae TaxID=260714 RepID=UPI0021533D65
FTYPIIDYIIFLDSDDYWELNCIEECVPRMEGVEIVWFDYGFKYEVVDRCNDYDKTYHDRYKFNNGSISSIDWTKKYPDTGINWFSFAWNGMIKFTFLKSAKLSFPDKIIHEDVCFGICLFIYSKYIFVLNEKLYNYRIRELSLCDHDNSSDENWISPFYRNIYFTFDKNISDTKFYYRVSSEVITAHYLLKFMRKIKKIDCEIYKPIIDDRINALWNILYLKKDPLKVYKKIPKKLYLEKIKTLSDSNVYLSNIVKCLKSDNSAQIQALNQNIQEKEKLLSFQTKYGTAKFRIQNQLSYKLGQAMIVNSKNIFGILLMPIYLLVIHLSYKQEQKIYQEKIKKDSSLKLPSLEQYPDYQEALKEKECFTYKLGQALIQANKNWYGGGYIKLWFEIRKLKREIKQN